jgi:hypothetical protein
MKIMVRVIKKENDSVFIKELGRKRVISIPTEYIKHHPEPGTIGEMELPEWVFKVRKKLST